MSDIILLV